jgi:hypothetical protein
MRPHLSEDDEKCAKFQLNKQGEKFLCHFLITNIHLKYLCYPLSLCWHCVPMITVLFPPYIALDSGLLMFQWMANQRSLCSLLLGAWHVARIHRTAIRLSFSGNCLACKTSFSSAAHAFAKWMLIPRATGACSRAYPQSNLSICLEKSSLFKRHTFRLFEVS